MLLSKYKNNKNFFKTNKKSTLTLKFIVIRIDDFEVLLGDSPGALILVEPENTLQELYHLLLVLVPHGGAGVDPGHVVAALHRRRWRARPIRLLVDRLVVSVAFLFLDLRQVLYTRDACAWEIEVERYYGEKERVREKQ